MRPCVVLATGLFVCLYKLRGHSKAAIGESPRERRIMGIVELLLIAVGLSMDAFAVSICKGLGMKKVNMKVAVVLALFFGGFQGLMPLIGWALGSQFLWLIAPIDHWIAFGLLAVIGGKMIWEALHDEEGEDDGKPADRIDLGEFFILAITGGVVLILIGLKVLLEHLGFLAL